MNAAVNNLANAVLKKPLTECSLDELQQLAQQYPYFGPAHFLLAKKLSIEADEQEDYLPQYEEQVQKASLYFQNRVWLDYLLNDDGINDSMANHPAVIEKEEPAEDSERFQAAENIATEEIHEQTETPFEIPAATIEPIAEPLINENIVVQPGIESGNEETAQQAEPAVEHNETAFEMPALKIEPITTAAAGIIFEPYHTVDYFASQGIKFKENEIPKDRFSVQLKSFTEWLKTMKRVPATEPTATTESNADNKVERMAEHSLAERHVITEAMAEVWEKQGNKARAEDIYRKLSLLDPSKSSYFATKIEALKKTN